MSTGYTAGVADGTVTDFREYALLCARNFGACVTLRDEPLSARIPEFVPSPYYEKRLTQAKAELEKLRCLTDAEADAEQQAEIDAAIASRERNRSEQAERRGRYERMLAKARAFVPPSEDHKEYAEFLVSQLVESLRFDCSGHEWPIPEKVSPSEWRQRAIADTLDDIATSQKYMEEEIARTNSRNKWVRQLKEALDA